MNSYCVTTKDDGTIEFWTDNEELRTKVLDMIEYMVDAIKFRHLLQEVDSKPI